jgi:hypothetical protein
MSDITSVEADNSERPVHRMFLSADVRRDGSAAFAWLNETTGKKRSEDIPRATKIEAVYECLLSALKGLPDGARSGVFSDSARLCGQVHGVSPVIGPRVRRLSAQILWVIRRRRLDVTVLCVPRSNNRAWKRLRKGRWQRG